MIDRTQAPEAQFWSARDGRALCHLCPRACSIPQGQRGACRVREATGGVLRASSYARISSSAIDPIEKKPLYHFFPGTDILSVGSVGCNLTCAYCQNWRISQREAPTRTVVPSDLVALADDAESSGSIGVAFTYSEPTVWFEYVCESAAALRAKGHKVVLVTNGFINRRPLEHLLPHVDAMNIDVKAFSGSFYRDICGGTLGAVMETVETCIPRTHVEVTSLLVPGLNDSPAEVGALSEWLAELSPDTPLHLTRYFPSHRLDLPPTPIANLVSAREAARENLRYVYIGNADVPGASDTTCPGCGISLITRSAQGVAVVGMVGPVCGWCGRNIAMVR